VNNNGDCNDNNSTIHPGATEICNGIDDDCDGEIDEALTIPTWYRDLDEDGYGDPNSLQQACTQPQGYVHNNTDCDDNNPAIHPEATEICNGIDDDCDGSIDEGVTLIFYRDADGDSYGDPNNQIQACTLPAGYVNNNSDCDDNQLLYDDNDGDGFGAGPPVACGVPANNDCNDNNIEINPNTAWFLDADNDGYYTGTGVIQCASPGAGFKYTGLIAGGDCDDANENINPAQTEICSNNIDDNCNGQINEGCPTVPIVTINDVTVYESQHQAMLTVSLSTPSNVPVKVNYKTIDGTAKKPKDYKNTNGNITIPAGNLTATIIITVIQDNIPEPTEYFDVEISLPKVTGQTQNVILGDDVGRVTILDEPEPLITKASTEINTNNKKSLQGNEFNVHLYPNPSQHDFTMQIASNSIEPIDIRLYDITGQLIKKIESTHGTIRFGSELRTGIYLVEVRQQGYKKVIKLIKL
jgi:hypothetical protein